MIYDSPLHTARENLEIAIGAIESRDRTIENLRHQISALRSSLMFYGMNTDSIDLVQYRHLMDE